MIIGTLKNRTDSMLKDISHKEDVLVSLEKTTSDLFQLLDRFDQQNINRIPFEDSWTAAQLADHITRSNLSITKALLLSGVAINRDKGARIKELKEIFLDFKTKMKSPEFIQPTKNSYEKITVLNYLKQSFQKMLEVGRRTDMSVMINHPAFGDITKFEILHFVLYHTQRHIYQLEKIFQAISGR
jgi:hypothetical protein